MTSIESSKRIREHKSFDVVRRVTVEYRYSVRCNNAREARVYGERAFEQTEADVTPYRKHIGHNVWSDFVRSHTKVHDIGISDFEQDDDGPLTMCECEHGSHFDPEKNHTHYSGIILNTRECEQDGAIVRCHRCISEHVKGTS